PRFYSVTDGKNNTVRYPLIYFIESDNTISPTTINRDADGIGTVDVTVNLSEATSPANFQLKRRVASYPYKTYTSAEKKITIDKADAINGFFSFKLNDLPIANEDGINYLYRITDAYGTKLELPMTHSTTGENTKDIIIGPVSSESKGFVFKLQRFDGEYELDNETGEQKLDEEGQPIPIYHDVESFTAETYFKETTPLIIYPAANVSDQENTHYGSARYTIPASDKIGGVYSFKIIGLAEGTYRIFDARNETAFPDTVIATDGTAIFTVSGLQNDLTFYIQKENNGSYTDILYSDAGAITVGKYYEEIVKQDKNGTALRLEYFPANVVTDTVVLDHYGNPIGYEDNGDKEHPNPLPYTSTNGEFSIPAADAYKISDTHKQFSVLVKDLPLHNAYRIAETSGASVVETVTNVNANGTVTLTVKATAQKSGSTITPFTFKLQSCEDGVNYTDYADTATATDAVNSANTYSHTNGKFTINSADWVHDDSYTVVIRNLPYNVYTYSATGSDVTTAERPAGDNKVDLLVQKTVDKDSTDNFTFTVQRSANGGTSATVPCSDQSPLQAVRFFVTATANTYNYENGLLSVSADNAYQISDTQKKFSVLVKGLPEKDGSNDTYTYTADGAA
ncbi:MAG: hypothetical protein VZR73_13670, partial [Acutalibacteraceae bacterium]|nr:hypothetical protein [Acutalibacteraceae bacterium]